MCHPGFWVTFSAILAHSYGMELFDSFDNTVKTPVLLSQPCAQCVLLQFSCASLLCWARKISEYASPVSDSLPLRAQKSVMA
jgi:hypothetical protein